jgi:uncharacterized protein
LEILVVVIPGIMLALLLSSWAHFANDRKPLAILLYLVFGIAAAGFATVGAATVLLSERLAEETDAQLFGVRSGIFMLAMGTVIGVSLLNPFRALLARVVPIDSRSMSDMVGLIVMMAVCTFMVWTIDLTFADENGADEFAAVGEMTLILQAVLLVAIGYFAVGGAINRDWTNTRQRLGLTMPTSRQVVISIALIIPMFIVSAIGGVLTDIFQPGFTDSIDEIMGEVTGDLVTVQGAILIGLSAGIGEEILFRGAIQPRFGILFTSIVFTLIHVQYGFSFVLLGVFLTSIILGIQRKKMNTTCCIITHATYNFGVMMISVLAASQM